MTDDTHTPQESSQALEIRRATEADSKEIWEWRNDPTTRANSINTDEVCWDIHNNWYQKSLQNPDRFLYIGIDTNGNKVGMCRLDVVDKEIEVSINLNPAFRNQRLSAPLLTSSIRQFQKSANLTLLATIKRTNIASKKCFLNAGFTHSSEDSEYDYYAHRHQATAEAEKLKLIDEIESIRSNNNINWMNLLRLSFQVAPEEAKLLFRKINADDQRISELFSKLAE